MQNSRDISFASMNLYNLQVPGGKMYRGATYNQAEYDAKIAWTAGMLRHLQADVIAFQELWSRQALVDAFAKAGLTDAYELAFIKNGSWRGITVAAAVRKPWVILERERFKQFPLEMSLTKRDVPEDDILAPDAADIPSEDVGDNQEDEAADIRINKFSRSPLRLSVGHSERADVPPISVFCCHLKAKMPTQLDRGHPDYELMKPHATAIGAALSTIRRTAEATALRVILSKYMKANDVPTVVLGDLNDGQMSNTLNILSDQPSYRVYADSRSARRNDDGLYSAVTMQQLRTLDNVLYTHVFKGAREVLDHVLVSEQFYEHSDRRRWAFQELKVWNDHVEEEHDESSSDHGVVRAKFDWWPA